MWYDNKEEGGLAMIKMSKGFLLHVALLCTDR